MRQRSISMLARLVTLVPLACASGTYSGSAPTEDGGVVGNAGNTSAARGGTSALGQGGGPASGGHANGGTTTTVGNGGTIGSGGSGLVSGGTSSSGGASGAGGVISMTRGGTSAAGGAAQGGAGPGSGGNTASGGAQARGGQTGSGGTSAQGGNQARGGTGSGGTGSGGAGKGGSGSGGATQCTPPTGGSQGYTTRFWDCCKSSCSWSGNVPGGKNPVKSCNQQNQSTGAADQSACSGGPAFACWDLSPWAVSDTLAYGYAAFNGGQCGQCYQLKFTGQSNSVANEPGSASLCGKTMIVQVVNIGNIAQGQFDIMIPGGGVGDFNACSNQWGVSGSALGEQYGGVQLTCQRQSNDYATRKTCTTNACTTLFKNSNQSTLLAGCKWSVDWLGAADNPKMVYQQIACPSEITSKSGLQ